MVWQHYQCSLHWVWHRLQDLYTNLTYTELVITSGSSPIHLRAYGVEISCTEWYIKQTHGRWRIKQTPIAKGPCLHEADPHKLFTHSTNPGDLFFSSLGVPQGKKSPSPTPFTTAVSSRYRNWHFLHYYDCNKWTV